MGESVLKELNEALNEVFDTLYFIDLQLIVGYGELGRLIARSVTNTLPILSVLCLGVY